MLLFVLLIAALLVGVFVVAAVLLLTVLGTRQETRRLSARVEILEGEVQRLRHSAAGGQSPPQPQMATAVAATVEPPAAAATAHHATVDQPAPASAPVPAPAPTREAGAGRHDWFNAARAWLFGGNTVVRLGVVILFFGVAFFLGYVAERGLLPVEFRLSGAATAGAALLVIGWRLRKARRDYALALQGGGAGIVYLTVFAAANFYDLIGASAGLGIMVVLVVLTSVLAVTQNARSLAVLASLGGFLGPVLISREGSHVALFSYYAALDFGIVAVAWFRAWRVLNLLGFVFTFIIGAMWGSAFYKAEHFATMQPFLALFFILFAAIPVLSARRQAPRLTGYVDGTLVFGVPLAAYVLQHRLASGFEYGPAFSALAFSVFYAIAAGTLHWRGRRSMPLLVQSFAALAVAFGTLAIPLAFDGRWTSAAWALEGAALVWVGARQARRLAVLSGLALQLLAGLASSGGPPADGLPVLNIVYLGGLLLSLSGLFSARMLHRTVGHERTYARLSVAAFVWGTLWWFGAGAAEISRHLASFDEHSATLVFVAVSFVASGWLRTRLNWKHLAYPPQLLLPAMLIFTVAWLSMAPSPLARWGSVAWPGAFVALYWLLRHLEADWRRTAPIWHRAALWLATFFVSWETYWRIGQLMPGGGAWSFVIWALTPAAVVWSLTTFGSRLEWPVLRFREAYLGTGQIPLALFVAGWVLIAATHRGDPDPLGYVPILNPVELVQIFVLGFLLWWSSAGAVRITGDGRWGVLGLLAFATLNGIIARATHFLADVPFRPDALWPSAGYQTTLSIAWTAAAFTVMFSATRLAWRRAWWAGAALLAAVVIKLFTVDLADIGTVARIVSFSVVGGLILVLGYVSPLPPREGRPQG